MKQTKIPAGYRVTVTSWENDGDNYRTNSIDGLSCQDAKLLVNLSRLQEGEFGNMYEPSDEKCAKYSKACKKVFDVNPHDPLGKFAGWNTETTEENADELASEMLQDLFGSSEYYYTRVCEEVVVEYLPQDIFIDDVTKEFVK